MKKEIYSSITRKIKEGEKLFSLLIDPDKFSEKLIDIANKSGVDYFFVGGSLLTNGNLEACINNIKQRSDIPVLLFPGNIMQISPNADGILLLSLISGRNADMLIGNHVIAAPTLKSSKLEIISTGYMLIEGGNSTSVSYMSNTLPIPADKDDISMCTAMAGEMLGMKMIYLEAGSGAKKPVSSSMIKRVKQQINIPLIVGGGISSAKDAENACKAGADMIVVGNAAEKDITLVTQIANSVHCMRLQKTDICD